MADSRGKVGRRDEYHRDVHQEQFPSFRKPSIIGYYGVDGHRSYRDGIQFLKYFVKPKGRIEFDLNKGLDSAIKKNDSQVQEDKLNTLLLWILKNIKQFRLSEEDESKRLNTDFVCFRGLLTTLLCTPYENKEGWIICATKFRGTIYLFAIDTEQKKRDRENASQKMKTCSAWGYKFEQYMLADSPGTNPKADVAVNENEEFCCVFRTRLENHSLVYGAEMDGVDSKTNRKLDPESPDWSTVDFVELKTSRVMENDRQERNFKRFKLIKWWAQTFLVGIPRVICGFRDDYGNVQNLVTYDVNKLHRMAESYWDPCVCMHYAKKVLNRIKRVVVKDNPRVVWKFEWHPGREVDAVCLGEDSFHQILPEWYIEKLTM